MSLFTPGPWKVERVGGNLFTQVKPVYQPTAWTPSICTLHEPDAGEIAPEVERANARLIAAAPDLLAACQAALDFYEWHMSAVPSQVLEELVDRRTALQAQLKAAIAKAVQP